MVLRFDLTGRNVSAGDVRLTDGGVRKTNGEGLLQVFHRGEWGTVCDDRMDAADNIAPKLACRLLRQGYEDGLLVEDHGYSGDPLQPIWLDDLRWAPQDLGGTRVRDPSPLGDIGTLVWLSLPGGAVGAQATLGRLTALRWVWPGTAAP